MGFETIQLTGQQLEELYSSHLVISGSTDIAKSERKSKPANAGITGKNKKLFVWVVNEPEYPFLSDADFQFLSDVITACKMNMDDIALVNIAQNGMGFNEVIDRFQPKYLIISFLDQNWITLQAEDYTLLQQQDYQLYVTESPGIVRNDKVRKSKLWLALKQMLGL